MRATLLSCALFALAGCCDDVSTRVNVAPSAEGHMDAVIKAVEHLNALTGMETYSLRSVSSEHTIDGEILIRVVPSLGVVNGYERRLGNTQRTRHGVLVRVVPDAHAAVIAHELGHAAGLKHVQDESNLMYPISRPDVFVLDGAQIEQIISVNFQFGSWGKP